jgi:hypothetical protein
MEYISEEKHQMCSRCYYAGTNTNNQTKSKSLFRTMHTIKGHPNSILIHDKGLETCHSKNECCFGTSYAYGHSPKAYISLISIKNSTSAAFVFEYVISKDCIE